MHPRDRTTGSVHALWRYPVKSMQGEALTTAVLGAGGIVGDRAYAILDRERGGIASAKHPRKWAALAHCRAAFLTPPQDGAALPAVIITLPNGATVTSDEPAVDAILSRVLNHPVTLSCVASAGSLRETDRTPLDADAPLLQDEPIGLAAPGTFFDVAPLHLLSTSTLERLHGHCPDSDVAVARFRPNIVLAPVSNAQVLTETDWIGSSVGFGACSVAVIDPTPRCVVITLARGGLPHAPQLLCTVGQQTSARSATLAPGVVFPGVVGVYARVVTGGSIRVGDVVVHPVAAPHYSV